jgi:AcrR family transcriptional regulator
MASKSSEAPQSAAAARRNSILDAAIKEFGRHGYRKTSIEDLAAAADISKQGLYLHFAGKNEVFQASMQKYLVDCMVLVDKALGRADLSLVDRLTAALDAWFGRHLATFSPASFDVIVTGDQLFPAAIEEFKGEFVKRIAGALAASPEFTASGANRSAKEVAQVLFLCGLTWKEGSPSPREFSERLRLCVRVCCHVKK